MARLCLFNIPRAVRIALQEFGHEYQVPNWDIKEDVGKALRIYGAEGRILITPDKRSRKTHTEFLLAGEIHEGIIFCPGELLLGRMRAGAKRIARMLDYELRVNLAETG